MQVRVGADVGGTFTDIVFLAADGTVRVAKVLSTPDDYSRAILDGLKNEFAGQPKSGAAIAELAHGTTVATNAILERKGARVGLLTTRGFRDVLEIRRVRMPVLYNLQWEKPEPLVRRALCHEIDERVGAGGTERKPLDLDSAKKAIAALKDEGVDAVAICFLHSYANDAHERAVGELAAESFNFVSMSCDVLPEMREYERTATTVVDAYVKPVVQRYLDRLAGGLAALGSSAPVTVMQSNGGVISAKLAASQPVRIIESGPAAGVVAARAAGLYANYENLITFDMGGTTAKASIIEKGVMTLAAEYEVGGAVSKGSRLIKGGGYLIRVPAIDVAEVGAGGGSIAWIDSGGVLRVGPESAGAAPGPACYGRGDEPTVTDANVILGFLNPEFLVGGDLRIDRSRAVAAISEKIANPLGLDLTTAAAGIHRVANSTMQRAIRSVSIERGRDPRDFALMAFGGNGPVHAAGLAAELDITRVIVPPWPGLFSAIGLLASNVELLYSQSLVSRLSKLNIGAAERVLQALEARARREFAAEGFGEDRLQLQRFADLRYRQQISEIMILLPRRPLRDGDVANWAEALHREHAATFGYDTRDVEVELVSLKLRARGLQDKDAAKIDWSRAPADQRRGKERVIYFGPDHGSRMTATIGRGDVGTQPTNGPVIIEEYDSTTVVPPDWMVVQPTAGFLELERIQ
jgi:N-methylhydantoinase A